MKHTPKARIVLGTMNFGSTVTEERSSELLDRFVESGGEWIDTADCYAFWSDPNGVGGQSERVIGRWLASNPGIRDRVRISTKVGQRPLTPHEWPSSAEGLSSTAVQNGIAGSLERLGTDHVDLLWAHAEFRSASLPETVEVFGDLVRSGVARQIGASNHPAWRVERARAIAKDLGSPAWSAIQMRYSLVQPRPGSVLPDQGHMLMSPDALDYAECENLDLWAYTPLVNGGLVRADRPLPEAYDHPGTQSALRVLDEVARESDATRNQVVLAWLMSSQPAISPIVGVSNGAQLDEAMAAVDLQLDADQLARLARAR